MNEAGAGQNERDTDVVVVGAGQAGVSVSYYLTRHDIDHVVLERDVPFSAWRNRWDGFITNTTNRLNMLPMLPRLPAKDPDGFATREEIVRYLDECLETFDPPIETGVEVVRVSYREPYSWEVETIDDVIYTRHVVMCTGAMSRPWVPDLAADLPAEITQMHSSEFRNPEQITTPRVLIVGGGSSGVQICRLLAETRRHDEIHIAAGKVVVLPRRVLGIQTHRLFHVLGLFDLEVDSLLGRMIFSRLETTGDPIVPPTPRELAKMYGVVVHPKFTGWRNGELWFEDGGSIGPDDLTIVWCTGLRGDYRALEAGGVQVFDEWGRPRHRRGVVAETPGLSFVGLRHQYTAASHDIYGVGNDARYVVSCIKDVLRERAVRVG